MASLALAGAFSDLAPDRRGRDDAPPVGLVTQQFGEARRKADRTLIWESLVPGDAVHNRDAVFVPEGGLAVVSLDDGSTVLVGASSLVVMERSLASANSAPTNLHVMRGLVSGQAGAVPLRVRAAGASLVVDGGARAAIDVSRARLRVEGLAGRTMVESGGTRVDLGADASARVEAGGVLAASRREFALLSPARAEPIYFVSEAPKVALSWTGGPAGIAQLVEVSSDPDFREIVHARSVLAAPAVFSPPREGVYYWRVSAGVARSEERPLVVVHDTPPVALQPRNGSIVYSPEGAAVAFFWSRAPNAVQYRLEIATDPGFTQHLVDTQVRRTEHWFRGNMPEGTYYWRVRASGAGRDQAPPSVVERFRLARQPLPRAPRLYDPQLDFVPPAPAPEDRPKGTWLWRLFGGVAHADERAAASGVVLRWEAVPGVPKYVIEIALDKGFESIVLRQELKDAWFRWGVLPDRNYYWRVRSIDRTGREGDFSDPRLVGPILSLPDPIAPADGTVVWPDAAAQLKLTWSTVRTSAHYIVQLSPDASFEKGVDEHRVDGASHLSWAARAPGPWHWRVRSVDAAGDSTDWGATFRFDVRAAAPELVSPRRNAEVELAADGIALEWARGSDSRWQVEVSPRTAFAEGTLAQETVEPSARAPVDRPGTWYWRVRGADAAGRWGPWGLVGTFQAVLVPPVPGAPDADLELTVREPPLDVLFRWTSTPVATAYVLELLADEAGAPVRTLDSAATQLAVALEPGRWQWQVRAVAVDGSASAPSERRTLSVRHVPLVAAPALSGPPADARIVCRRAPVVLGWSSVEGAARYDVELAGEGADPAAHATDATRLELPGLALGAWRWRARSLEADGTAGPWGEPRTFTCEPPPPAVEARVRIEPEVVPADGSVEATIEVALLDALGAPAEDARLAASASSGELSAPEPAGPARWTLRYRPNPEAEQGDATVALRDAAGGFSASHAVHLWRPPPWKFEPHVFAGSHAGFAHNLGDLWTPRLAGEVGFHFRFREWWLAASAVVGYGWAGRTVAERGGSLTADASLHAVPVELRALVLEDAAWGTPYAGLALTMDLVRASARVPGQPDLASGGALFGASGVAGVERSVGSVAVFLEASLGWASRLSGVFDVDARGASLGAGVRWGFR